MSAQSLQYLGQFFETGGGLGAVPTILTIQRPGNTSSESGCVGPTKFDGCGYVNGKVQKGQTQMRPIAEFPSLSGEAFRLIFNAVEPGNDKALTIESLTLTLYGNGDQTFRATLPTSLSLTGTGNGIGNYGHSFGLASQDWSAFDDFILKNPEAWIGLGASINNVHGGHETFSVSLSGVPSTAVPEPSTYALMATGLATLVIAQRRRRSSPPVTTASEQ